MEFIICGIALVLGVAGHFLFRKKKPESPNPDKDKPKMYKVSLVHKSKVLDSKIIRRT